MQKQTSRLEYEELLPKNLIDLEKIKSFLKCSYQINKLPIAFFDQQNRVIASFGHENNWSNFFHKNNYCPKNQENNIDFLHSKKAYVCSCDSGFTEAVLPIHLSNKHLGSLISGGFFIKGNKPDKAFFQKIAEQNKLDKSDFLKEIENIPVLDDAKIQEILTYLDSIGALILDGATARMEHFLQMETISEYSTDFIWEMDLDANIKYISPAVQKLTIYKPSDFKFSKISVLFDAEDYKRLKLKIIQLIRNGTQSIDLETTIIRKDGSRFPAEIIMKLLMGDDDQPVSIRGSIRNISERMAYIAEINESREHFKSIVDTPTNYALYRLRAGASPIEAEVIMISKSFANIVGIHKNEINNFEAWFKNTHPEDLPRLIASNERGCSPPFKFDEIARINHPTKGLRWIHIQSSGIPFQNDKSKIEYANGIVRDISSLKQAEQKAEISQERYKLATTAANTGIWDWAVGTDEVYFSSVWKAQVGYLPEELPNLFSSWQNLLHPDDYAPMHQKVENYLKNPDGVFTAEFRLRHKNGSYRWIFNRAQSTKNSEGQVVRMLGAHIDITERKEAENALLESEKRLNLSLEINDSSVFEDDFKTGGMICTPELFRSLGYNDEEVPDTIDKMTALMHPDDVPAVLLAVEKHFKKESDFYYAEFRLKAKNGEWRWVDGRGQVVKWDHDENPHILIGISRDISYRKTAEDRIKQSEKRLRELINTTSKIVWFTDGEGFIHEAQTGWEDFTGQPFSAYKGIGWMASVHPDDRVDTKIQWKKAIRNQTPLLLEHRLRHRSGRYRFMSIKAVPISDDKGNITEWIGAHTDIDVQKKAQLSLQENEQKYRQLFHNLNAIIENKDIAIWSVDCENKILALNSFFIQLFEKIFGVRLKMGQNCIDQIPDSYAPWRLQWSERFARAFNGEVFKELDIYTIEGKERYFEIMVNPITAEGIISGAVVFAADVSGEYIARKELKNSEEQLRNVFESVTDALVIFKRDGTIVEVNPAACQMYAYPYEELIKTKTTQLITKESRKEARDLIDEVDRGRIYHGETIDLRKDGGTFHTYVIGTGVHFRGMAHFMAIVRDVTDMKNAEKKLTETLERLKDSNAQLEQFAYVASHDLREPLRMITSFLQILEMRYKEQLDKRAKNYIAFAVDGAKRMDQLIKDLLLYSRIGTKGSGFENTKLMDVLQDVKMNLHHSIQENKPIIEIGKLPEIMADKIQLVQLFQNLISNAIKFKRQGKTAIKISAQEENDTYCITVADNGIGISEDNLERVFEIFQRLHTREEYEGTGIGLAICKKIMERHNGKISVESKLGEGSTFSLFFPKLK